ncbi:vanadium-dependent haloperoxidase [Chelativorans sp. YIM 93263]|uniref:vanadium-dependent haloperoxidase n=1 Tax=Chelativorans sp. YIM 93263 TaxID=2906648 RepID=UPI0023793CBC|nr:vanadium-dependent haloperoxidase [Chelativorans sp. YIM 93263]
MVRIRHILSATIVVVLTLVGTASAAEPARGPDALRAWYKMVLELVRHTPTYSPPVASRSFAYLGVTAFEAMASGSSDLHSLAGQVNGLTATPLREPGAIYDEAVILDAAMASAVRSFFGNTGPTGQRALEAIETRLSERVSAGLPANVVKRSRTYGRSIAAHIFAWSETDGGATVENMGFPLQYELTNGPAHWVPTSTIGQQQTPLLPKWGENRTFAMPDGMACPLPAPPPYSEEEASEFYREALEVYETVADLSEEQRTIARFWSDDPMLSPTPPGHWISIAWQVLDKQEASLSDGVDLMARLGVSLADSFIRCWQSKYEFDLVRPVTYIRRLIDPDWEPVLITPPFPEYPSGHSTQSGAAAAVLTAFFGDDFAFDDATHEDDGLPARTYRSFEAAAEEAAISRLYGGIHFRAAIDRGLEQGRCIGAYATALRTRI